MNYLWEAMLRAKEQKMETDRLRFAMAERFLRVHGAGKSLLKPAGSDGTPLC